MKDFYYVFQENSNTGEIKLLGYNLNKEQSDKLFYSLGREKNSSCGHEFSGDLHLSNGCGCHSTKFRTDKEAFRKLITIPDEFNKALELINNAGFDVVKKGLINPKMKVVSYQAEFPL